MGWLHDLAEDTDFKSFRQLAKAMKENEGSPWPADDKRAWTTVATKLGTLDKGVDVDWWMGTGAGFLPALAFVLGMEEADLHEHITDATSGANGGPTSGWVFGMFPALRPLDLRSEKPFPGVPSALMWKGGPQVQRTWWVAPSGAGKTLVGRWLEAQYGWVYLDAPDWTTALLDLPMSGRVFLELASAAGAPPEALIERADLRLCVACPSAPPKVESEESRDGVLPTLRRALAHARMLTPHEQVAWVIEETPPAEGWAVALIDWAAARVRPGGGFDAAGLRRLFADPEFRALFHSPGGALEFFGIVEEVGMDALDSYGTGPADPLRLVSVWFKAALARPDRERPPGIEAALRGEGATLLLELCKARLRAGLGASLTEDEWVNLVPPQLAPALDRDRLLRLVEQGGSDLQTRLQNELRPDGQSLVRGLVAAGALGPGPDRFELRPRWVAELVAAQALQEVYEEGPQGVGSLLLAGETAEDTLLRMIEEAAGGRMDAIRRCVDADLSTLEGGAALDGAVRALGLAAAMGRDFDQALARELWSRQAPTLVRRFTNWPPIPMVHTKSTVYQQGATSPGGWFLAVLALTERVAEPRLRRVPRSLDPWNDLGLSGPELDCLISALTTAERAFKANVPSNESLPLALATHRVGAALLDRLGVLREQGQPTAAQGPDLLVALAAGRDLELDERDIVRLLGVPFGLPALRAACARQGRDLDEVLAWCWQRWGSEASNRDAFPPFAWAPGHCPAGFRDDADEVWKSAPAQLLADGFLHAVWDEPAAWPFLTSPIWIRLIEAWSKRNPQWSHHGRPFEAMPVVHLKAALRAVPQDSWSHELRAALWRRLPQEALLYIDELVMVEQSGDPNDPGHGGPVSHMVWSAPADRWQDLLRRARAWLTEPTKYPGVGAWVLPWLHSLVESGGTEGREAFHLLFHHKDALSSALHVE